MSDIEKKLLEIKKSVDKLREDNVRIATLRQSAEDKLKEAMQSLSENHGVSTLDEAKELLSAKSAELLKMLEEAEEALKSA